MDTHIHINGEIGSGGFSAKHVTAALMENPTAKKIHVHINSFGGDVFEGFAIFELLRAQSNLGVEVITIIETFAFSIASVVFLAGDVRSMGAGTELMIHNPWAQPAGDADALERFAEKLRIVEGQLASFYSEHTSLTVDQVSELMSQETFMSAEESLKNGFATIIADNAPVLEQGRIAAKLSAETCIKRFINREPKEESMSFFEKLKASFETKVKALEVTTISGITLNIEGDAIAHNSGVADAEGNQAQDGVYKLNNGEQITVKNGLISDHLTEAQANDSSTLDAFNKRLESMEKDHTEQKEANEKANEAKDAEILALKGEVEKVTKEAAEKLANAVPPHDPLKGGTDAEVYAMSPMAKRMQEIGDKTKKK